MQEPEFKKYLKNRFKNLTNKDLINLINKLYALGKNDDDQVSELVRRRGKQGFEIIVGFDTYEIK